MNKEFWFLHNIGIHVLNIPRRLVNAWRTILFWLKRFKETGSVFGDYRGRRRVTMETMKLVNKIVVLAGGSLNDSQVARLQRAVNRLPHVNITKKEITGCFTTQRKSRKRSSHTTQKAP